MLHAMQITSLSSALSLECYICNTAEHTKCQDPFYFPNTERPRNRGESSSFTSGRLGWRQ